MANEISTEDKRLEVATAAAVFLNNLMDEQAKERSNYTPDYVGQNWQGFQDPANIFINVVDIFDEKDPDNLLGSRSFVIRADVTDGKNNLNLYMDNKFLSTYECEDMEELIAAVKSGGLDIFTMDRLNDERDKSVHNYNVLSEAAEVCRKRFNLPKLSRDDYDNSGHILIGSADLSEYHSFIIEVDFDKLEMRGVWYLQAEHEEKMRNLEPPEPFGVESFDSAEDLAARMNEIKENDYAWLYWPAVDDESMEKLEKQIDAAEGFESVADKLKTAIDASRDPEVNPEKSEATHDEQSR